MEIGGPDPGAGAVLGLSLNLVPPSALDSSTGEADTAGGGGTTGGAGGAEPVGGFDGVPPAAPGPVTAGVREMRGFSLTTSGAVGAGSTPEGGVDAGAGDADSVVFAGPGGVKEIRGRAAGGPSFAPLAGGVDAAGGDGGVEAGCGWPAPGSERTFSLRRGSCWDCSSLMYAGF